MSVVGKALWLIESNLSEKLSLHDMASALQVTPFHLARAFVQTTGLPMMRYVWRRRLTRAAEALAQGPASVLTIALDAGYASHEAFGRAFRAEFGLTPSALRDSSVLATLPLTPSQHPRSKMPEVLQAPKVEVMPTRRFAGPAKRYDMQGRAHIPAQWVAYNTEGARVIGAVPNDYFGVVFNYSDDMGTFDYMCGQEVPGRAVLPTGFKAITISGAYARFATKGHISTINAVWSEIYEKWLAQPDFRPRKGPSVEYYPPEFSGTTGNGGFELWVPVQA